MAASTPVDVAPPFGVAEALQRRIIEATLRCVARWGVAKSTVDDIASEAGCSRATIYRTFPGGKDALLTAAAQSEVSRFFTELDAELADQESLSELVAAGIAGATRFLTAHEALSYLSQREVALILPHVAFDRIAPLLAAVEVFAAPHLARFVEPQTAREISEWATRVVIDYVLLPSATVHLDDPGEARRFVDRYLVPGLVTELAPSTVPISAMN